MGNGQSVALLKKGDWVLTKDRGIGWVGVVDYLTGYALIEFGSNPQDYSNFLYEPKSLTKLPDELYPILSDSISN
jgi:hypothetical protein